MKRIQVWLLCCVGASFVLTGCSGPVGPKPQKPVPAAIISVDTVVVLPGARIEVPVRISYPADAPERLDSLTEIRLLARFDSDVLIAVDSLAAGSAISDWSYFSASVQVDHRSPSTRFGQIYVSARRTKSRPDTLHQRQAIPEGILTTLIFTTKPGYASAGLQSDIWFASQTCTDNSLDYSDDRRSYYIANTNFPNCDPEAAYDTTWCLRRVQFAPVLSFHRGHVRIEEPDNAGQAGDINGNGVPFEVSDAVLFTNVFPTILGPPTTHGDSLWQNAGDCNRDGVPFTIADLDFMLGYITGETQLADTLLPANVDTLYLAIKQRADTLTIMARANQTINILWLDLMGRWETDVGVTWVGSVGTPLSHDQLADTLRLIASPGNTTFGPTLTDIIRIIAPGMPFSSVRDWEASEDPGISVAVKEVPPPPPIFTFSIPTMGAVAGGQVSVPINLTYENGIPERGIGGCDLYVRYDPEVMTLRSVDRGAALSDWEYTTYRNAGAGVARFVGIVDMNDGHTPNPSTFESVGEYAVLHFDVTADVPPMGTATPLQFILRECGNNVLSSRDGTVLFIPDLTLGNPVVDNTYDNAMCLEGESGIFDYVSEPAIELWSGSVRISGSP